MADEVLDPRGLEDPRAPWEEAIEDPSAPRALLAVLFTDIVGSTELATALGDKRWRELLEQHDAAVREQIARFEGREVDTAGDAFFATFGRPMQAIDCALESARAVRRLGFRIRAGVHMGECVVSDGKVRGVTVHIGARVGAKARGDEVIVSSTVRDLLAGQGLTFIDRGEQTLKGVDGKWRLYAVEPRVRDNEADLPPLLESEIAKPPVPVWKRRRALIAGLLAVILAAAATTFAVTRGGGLSSVPADSIAAIDAGSGRVESATAVGRRPTGIAVSAGGVWVANSVDRTVSSVAANGSVDTVGPLGASPTTLTASPDSLWIANADDGTVSRVSLETKRLVGEPIRAGNGLSDITYGGGSIWVTNAVDGTVVRLDSSTGKVASTLRVGPALRGIIATNEAVWTVSETAGTVSRIDPRANSIVEVIQVGNGPRSLALGAGALWVANTFDGTVSRIDPEGGTVRATIRVGRDPRSIAIAAGRVFVANETDGTVSVIDPKAGNKVIRTIRLQSAPMGLAADGDRVWVSVRGGILRYRGGTLRFGNALDGFLFRTIDPMHAWNLFGFAISTAAYDTLLSYKRVGGVEGSVILPDLAEKLVPPTDGGKTYSFRLRRGLKYSSGAAVVASDVRKSFERMFRGEAFGAVFFGAILGTERCTPQACDLSQGIVTDDTAGTVIFHLRQQVVEFPYLLAIPLASIVPGDAPIEDAKMTPIPGTGPYYITNVKGGGADDDVQPGELTLERNPHFVPRGLAAPDGYPDRIIATWNGAPEDHIEAVKAGREDWSLDTEFAGPLEELANEVPGQFHVFETLFTRWVTLNENIPPLNDPRVRRAINLAVDRRAMAEIAGAPLSAELTCQILPPGIIGHVPYCPYTINAGPQGIGVWHGPDLATARRLVAESGTRGARITLWVDPESPLAGVIDLAAKAMREIGYRTVIRHRPGGEIFETALDDPKQYQSILGGWFADFPSASNFTVPGFACPPFADRVLAGTQTSANTSHFCSQEVDGRIAAALDAMEDDVLGAADLWAAVDRAITDAAPVIPYITQRAGALVSTRVGNVQFHPVTGILLSQMWLSDRK